jgi:hypothetical protein
MIISIIQGYVQKDQARNFIEEEARENQTGRRGTAGRTSKRFNPVPQQLCFQIQYLLSLPGSAG